ncbi:MAG TPA: GTPase [Acidobacteriota bacterium]|nr:GTPase [Acidobacteriota bacterium]
MPANLTPEYYAAEKQFKSATSPAEKMAALQEMLRSIPKHKGTEKMQADIKRRISRMRKEQARKGGPRKSSGIYVKKCGEGQVVLVGPPNAGKSELLERLSNANPKVADYPFTTRMPLPGMMQFENVQIQLVDLPPIAEGYIESWLPQIIRVADAALMVLSARNDDILSQYEDTLRILKNHKIMLYGFDEPEDLAVGIEPLLTMIVANKMDLPNAAENLEIFKEFYGDQFEILTVSTNDEESLNSLKRSVFDALQLLRIYTKTPGKEPDKEHPFVLHRGDTLHDLAEAIHKDIAGKLKTAKVWGSGKFDGQLVNKDYELVDEDIVEIHSG